MIVLKLKKYALYQYCQKPAEIILSNANNITKISTYVKVVQKEIQKLFSEINLN